MRAIAVALILLVLPVPMQQQDPCRPFSEVTISSCQSMVYDTWLTYTALWRAGTNSSYCNAGKEDFIEAWAEDTWITFGDGTYRDSTTGETTRIQGFHERSTHRSGVTRFADTDRQMTTAVHEALHHRYPAWLEGRVRREVKRLMDYLCIPATHSITFGNNN